MEKARLETFKVGKGWIHDKNKNHHANSKSVGIMSSSVIFSDKYHCRWLVQGLFMHRSKVGMTLQLAFTVISH